jgi:hypothetical protein
MNDDVRDLLRLGVGEAHDLPDTDFFWQQGRRRTWWRRGTGTAGGVLAVLVLAFVGQAWLSGPVEDAPPIDAPTRDEQPAPLRIGQLEPGSYEADWTPRFVLSPTDDTWRVIELDPDWLSLVRGADSLEIARWPSVVEPSAQEWDPDAVDSAPADLAAWLVGHPRLRTTSHTTSLGGLQAVRITARTLSTLDSGPPDCAGRPCVPLAGLGSSTAFLNLAAGEAATFYVLGDVGNQFVISYSAPPDRFQALEIAAEQLLGTLRFVED